ncbi:MAG: 3-hydroxyacyl-CoA dehydrogenase NAD-binding domain-containing protein [Terriglobales bacterium]|jgi:hypothetical protein
MEIRKVGALGCGLMGSGIAQVAATAGFEVTVLEVEQRFIDKGFATIDKSLAKLVEKGKIAAVEPIRAMLEREGKLLGLSARISSLLHQHLPSTAETPFLPFSRAAATFAGDLDRPPILPPTFPPFLPMPARYFLTASSIAAVTSLRRFSCSRVQ